MICELKNFTDLFITDFKSVEFQEAFKIYFDELNVRVEKWDKLFTNMNNDKHGKNFAYVRIADNGEIVGFIQFTTIIMNSWFFSTDIGFIREFWVNSKYRKQGHGKELLNLVESYFKEKDIGYTILTTDTAEQFYLKNGYEKCPYIEAVNKMDVYVKRL